jgi:hypothetical protein
LHLGDRNLRLLFQGPVGLVSEVNKTSDENLLVHFKDGSLPFLKWRETRARGTRHAIVRQEEHSPERAALFARGEILRLTG